ncbi:MAG TPA: DUF4129 domain-containing protein [Anaerolineales bacterium]|nr:DUF4129 domain-containing protein [Anaerolineales bacterium]
MRSLLENKRLVIVISVLTLGVLVLLSRGLRDLPFREGQSFAQQSDRLRAVPIQIVNTITEIPLLAQISMWAVVLSILALLGLLMNAEWRKRLIRIVIRVGITYWALYIVFMRYRERLVEMGVDAAAMNNNGLITASTGEAPPAFVSPQTITIATYIVSFGVALLIIVVAWKAYALWKELNVPSTLPLKKIAQIARSSIDDLSAGRESTDVIMNCYYRMSDVVSDKKNLERSASMTPGEFAARLERAGLPSDAVHRLTRLFEGVRYGARRSGPGEVHEAVASLRAILQHCGESA